MTQHPTVAPPSRHKGVLLAERYRISRHVGDGRMGEVYVGRDLDTNGRVALKLLHQPLCSVEQQVKRFQREFELTRGLEHPNVVSVLAFGLQPDGPLAGRHYLVMEFLEGRGLDAVLADGPMSADTATHIARQAADALSAVHERGVVHRDLKPENIQVLSREAAPAVKVMDFGLGRLQGGEGDAENLTDVGIRLGTVEYMAPEYIAHHQLDAKSDLYSLGCVLFHMLTGKPPYTGRSMKVMQDQVTAPARRPSEVVDAVPEWLDALVFSLLAKDPSERPESAAAVSRTLADLGATPLPAHRGRTTSRAPQVNSLPPSEGLASTSHLGDQRSPVYKEPGPAVPATPILVSVGLLGLAIVGMVLVGFLVGAMVLAFR